MKLALIITFVLTLIAISLENSQAATYNFNFYNNDQIVGPQTPENPTISKDSTQNPVSPLNTNAQPSQESMASIKNAATPGVLKYRVGVAWFADSYKQPESHEKKSELGYSEKNSGYRAGIGFGEKGGFIFTPYLQYSTYKFESTEKSYYYCVSVVSSGGTRPSSCYTDSSKELYQVKIPALGVSLEKEIMLGDLLISGIGAGGSYGRAEEADPDDSSFKKDVKQYSYYATAKLGLQLRQDLILNARAEYGKTLTKAVVSADYSGDNSFKIDNPYLRSMAELSYLF